MTTISRLLVANRGGDRAPGLRDLPSPRHRDRGRALRRRRRVCRTCARPTSPCGCPAPRRPTPTCVPTCWSRPRPRTGADAIHPGYGFLSENADFARAVEAAGLVWVGPTPESIEQMGSKIEAKRIMAAAGVPVLEAPAAPTEADLPAAGQGLRRRRRPRHADRARPSPTCPASSRRPRRRRRPRSATAPSSSSRTSRHGRHVEVQVVGHRDGVLVLGERDCSMQRRHQKVVEEAPAPRLPEATRAALHAAAAAAAAAIGYRGAGTVEFLYDPDQDSFYFLEMNTRLQVEHPVTELVFGVDLVELQLAVAEDRPLDAHAVGEVFGHAIEVRLYAEDPAADWQPQSGLLTALRGPRRDGGVRPPQPARPAPRRGLRVGRRGLDALRRDAGQGDRLGAHPCPGGPAAGRRAAPRRGSTGS